jgi:RES domain
MAKSASRFQPPSGALDATLVDWGSGRTMHRVHDAAYAANLFNPGTAGNARFSPIRDEAGLVIPTLYAATTPRGALMETIFHDVPYKSGFKRVSISRMAGKLHSTVTFQVDFRLIDLSRIALRKLGVAPSHLIDTTKAHYSETRRWAEALYAQYPKAQGLRWTSRQDDRSQAVVLFGTRVQPSDIEPTGNSTPLIQNGVVIDLAKALATDMGVLLD